MTGADLKSFKLLSEFSDDELDTMSELRVRLIRDGKLHERSYPIVD